jgi:hypothetical protein
MGSSPLETPKANKMEFFNEFMILSVLYCSMTFTDYLPDLAVRDYMGIVAIACVGLHIGVNMFLMIGESIHLTRLRTTRWKLWRKYAKIRGEKMLRR